MCAKPCNASVSGQCFARLAAGCPAVRSHLKRSKTRWKGDTGSSRAAAVMKNPHMSSLAPAWASSVADTGHRKGWQLNLQDFPAPTCQKNGSAMGCVSGAVRMSLWHGLSSTIAGGTAAS